MPQGAHLIPAWSQYTWDEWTVILTVRRTELLAAGVAGGARAQWRQDGWPQGRGGLERDGLLLTTALSLPRLRALPSAPASNTGAGMLSAL